MLLLMAIFAEQLAPYEPKDAMFELYHPPSGDAIRDLTDVKLRGRENQSE